MLIAMSSFEEILFKIANEPIVILGFAGQSCFFLRFLIQWIISEKKQKSVVPLSFWYISLVGAIIVFIYGWIVAEPILVIGQLISFFVYFRNLFLHRKNRENVRSIREIKAKIVELEQAGKKSEAEILNWALTKHD